MNEAIKLNFGECFSKRVSRFEIDLSNANLVQVMQSYQAHKNTRNVYYTVQHVIVKIQEIEEVFGQVLMPIDVTDIFYQCFINTLEMCDLQYSTIDNYCRTIRAALAWGFKHGGKISATYDCFKVPKHEPFRIVLNADEISHIAHFDVQSLNERSDRKRVLELVRDTFVIQANLFQRYSDVKHISPDNFKNNVFTCVQKKTSNRACVDILRYSFTPDLVLSLLKKYNYTCPYLGNINNFNLHLHYLLSKMGGTFDEEVVMEEKRRGEIIKIRKKKWQVVSSHCARRSSITYAVKNAKTENEVRRCSGHRNATDSFQKYIVD